MMQHLGVMWDKKEFSFILGSDLLPELSDWNGGSEFIDKTKFVVLEREGYPINSEILPPQTQTLTDNVTFGNVSSTIVRDRIREAY